MSTDYSELTKLAISELLNGVVLQRADGTIEMCNQSAADILGVQIDEFRKRKSLIEPSWRIIHESGDEFASGSFPADLALSTGREFRHVILGIEKKPGAPIIWIQMNCRPLGNPLRGVLTSFADLTEKKFVERMVAESKLSSGEIPAKVAQEMDTPLLTLEAQSRRLHELVNQDPVNRVEISKSARQIEGAVQRVAKIIHSSTIIR